MTAKVEQPSIWHLNRDMAEYCDRCDGCGWYEGGKTLQTECETCGGTGLIWRQPWTR